MSSNFDPKVIFHNSDKNTTVSVTVVDSVLNALTVNEEVSLTFNYEGKDVDQEGYVTFENRNTVLKVIGDLLDADLMFDRPTILKPLYNYDRFYGELISSPFVGKISGISHIRTVWTISRSKDFDDTRLQTKNEVITVDRGDLTRAQIIFNSEEEIYIKVKYVAEYTDGTGRHEVELTSFPKLCNAKITKPIRAGNIAILDEDENEVYQAKYYEKRKIAGSVEGLCYKIGLRLNNWYETTLEGNDVPLGGTPENATRVVVKVYNRNPDDPILPARYGEKFTNIEADEKFKAACDIGKNLCLAGKDYFILGKADSDGNNLAMVNSSSTDTYDQYFALDSEKGEIEYVEENRTLKIKPFKLWQSPYFSINSFCYLVVRIYRGDAGVEQHYKTIKLDLISSMLEKENLIYTPVDNFKHVLNVNKPYELSKHMNTITLNLDDSILNDIHESTTWEIVAMKKTYKPEDYKSFDNSSYPARPAIPRLFSLYRFKSTVFKKTLGYSVDDVMVLEDLKNKVPSNYNYMDKGWWAPREYKTVLPSPSIDSIADSLGAGNFYCTGDSFCRVFGINNTGIDFYNSLVNTNTSNITANPGDLIMSFRLEDGSIQVNHAQTGRLFIKSLDSTHCCHVVIIKDRDTNEILHSSVHYEKDSSNPSNTYNGDGLAGYVPITKNGSSTNLTYFHVDTRRNIEITCNKFENLSTPFNLISSFNTPKKRYEEFKRMNNLGSVPVDELVKGYVGLPIDSPYLQAAALGKLDLDTTYSKGEFNLYIKVTLNIRNAVSGMESSPVFIPLEIGKMNKYRGFNRNDHFVNTVWKHDFLASLAVNPDTDVMYNNKFLHKTFNPTTSVLNPLGHPMSTIHDFRTMKDTSISQCMAITPSLFLVKRKQEFKTIVFDSIEQLAYYFESLTKYSEPTKEAYDKKASGEYNDFDVALSRVDRRRMITIKTSKTLFDKLNYEEVSEARVENRDFYVYKTEGGDAASRPMNDYISTEHNTLCYFDSNMIFTEAYLQTYEDILSWLKTNVTEGTGELDQQPFFIDVYDVQGAPTRPKFREAIVVTISKEMVDKGIYFQGHDGILNKPIPLLTVDRAKSFSSVVPDALAVGPSSLSYNMPTPIDTAPTHHPVRYYDEIKPKPFNYSEIGGNVTEQSELTGGDGVQGKVVRLDYTINTNNETAMKLSSQVDLFSSNFEYYGVVEFKDCTEKSLLGYKGALYNIEDGYKRGQEIVHPRTGALYLCINDFTFSNDIYTWKVKEFRYNDSKYSDYNENDFLDTTPSFVKVSDHSLDSSTDDPSRLYVMPDDEYRKHYKSSLPTYVSLLSYLNLILPSHEGLLFDPTIGDKNKDWFDASGSKEGDGSMSKYRVFDLPIEYSGDCYIDGYKGEESSLVSSNVDFMEHYDVFYGSNLTQNNGGSQFNGTTESYTFAQSMDKILSYLSDLEGSGISSNYNNTRFSIDLWEYWKIIRDNFSYRGSLQDLGLNFGMGFANKCHSVTGCNRYKLTLYGESEEFRFYNNGSYVGNFTETSWSRSYAQVFWIHNKTDKTLKCILFNNKSSSNVDTKAFEKVSTTYRDFRNFTQDMVLYEESFDSPKEISILKADLEDSQYLKYNRTLNGSYGTGGEYDLYKFTDVNMVSTLNRGTAGKDNIVIKKTVTRPETLKSIQGKTYNKASMIRDSGLSKLYIAATKYITDPNPNGIMTGNPYTQLTLKKGYQMIDPTWDLSDGSHWIIQVNEFIDVIGYKGNLQDFLQNYSFVDDMESIRYVASVSGRELRLTATTDSSGNKTINVYIDGVKRQPLMQGLNWGSWMSCFLNVVFDNDYINGFVWNTEVNGSYKNLSQNILSKYETLRDLNSSSEVEFYSVTMDRSGIFKLLVTGAYADPYLFDRYSSYDTTISNSNYIVNKPPLNARSGEVYSRALATRTTQDSKYKYAYLDIGTTDDKFYLYTSRGYNNATSGTNPFMTPSSISTKIAGKTGCTWAMVTNELLEKLNYPYGLQSYYKNFECSDTNLNKYKTFNGKTLEIKIIVTSASGDAGRMCVYTDGSYMGYVGYSSGWATDWFKLITIACDGELLQSISFYHDTNTPTKIDESYANRYSTFKDIYGGKEVSVWSCSFETSKEFTIFLGDLKNSYTIYGEESHSWYYLQNSSFAIEKPTWNDLKDNDGNYEFDMKRNYATKTTFPYKYLEEYFKAYDRYDSESYRSVSPLEVNLVSALNSKFSSDGINVSSIVESRSINRFSVSVEDFATMLNCTSNEVESIFENAKRTVSKFIPRPSITSSYPFIKIKRSDDLNNYKLTYSFNNSSDVTSNPREIVLEDDGSDGYVALITVKLLGNSPDFQDKSYYVIKEFKRVLVNTLNQGVSTNETMIEAEIEKFKQIYTSAIMDPDYDNGAYILSERLPEVNVPYFLYVDVKYITNIKNVKLKTNTNRVKEELDTTIFGGWFKFKNKNYNNFIYMSTRPVLWVKDLKTIASANIAHPRQSIIRIGLKHYYVRLVTDRFYPDDDCCLDPVTLAGQQTSQPDFDTFNDPWCLNFRESLITPTIMSLCMLTKKNTKHGMIDVRGNTDDYCIKDVETLFYKNGEASLIPTKNYMIYSSNLMKRNSFFNNHGTVIYSAIPYKSPYISRPGNDGKYLYSYVDSANLSLYNSDVTYNLHVSQPSFEYGSDEEMFGKNEIIFNQPVRMSGFYLKSDSADDRLIFTYVRSYNYKVSDSEFRYSKGPHLYDETRPDTEDRVIYFDNSEEFYENYKDTYGFQKGEENIYQDYYPVHVVLEAIEEKDLPIYNIKDSLKELIGVNGTRTKGPLSSLLINDDIARPARFINNVDKTNITVKSNAISIADNRDVVELKTIKRSYKDGNVVPIISTYEPGGQLPGLSVFEIVDKSSYSRINNENKKTYDTLLEETSDLGQWISQYRRTWGSLDVMKGYDVASSYRMRRESRRLKLYDRWSGVGYLGTISSTKTLAKNTNGVDWKQNYGVYNTLTSQLEKILRHRLISSNTIREDDKTYIPVCHVFYYKGKIVLIPRETSFNIYEPDMYGFNYTKDMEYLEYGRSKPIDRTTRDIGRVKVGLNVLDPFLPYLSNDRSMHSLQELVRDIIPLYTK